MRRLCVITAHTVPALLPPHMNAWESVVLGKPSSRPSAPNPAKCSAQDVRSQTHNPRAVFPRLTESPSASCTVPHALPSTASFRPIPQPPPYSAHAVPFRDIQRCAAKLFAHTYLQRVVRVVQGRLARMRDPFAWVAGASGAPPELLACCGAEHCAALSGCRQVLNDVLAQHALWGQVGRYHGV